MKIVVKIGGSLLRQGIPETLLEDLAGLSRTTQIALVHGGGETVTEIATKLGKEQKFIVSPEGIKSRYTDRETAEIYTMVMSGLLAKRIVLSLRSKGVSAVSLTGLDGSLFQGKRKKKLVIVDERGRRLLIEGGYTGKVESVNSSLVESLMSGGYTPVISPVAVGEDSEPLNIDGDRAASSLASGISADAVVFLTNVEGLLLDGKLVESLSAPEASIKLPEVGFGMQKKVIAAADAVNAGVKEAIICSGQGEAPLSNALAHRKCTVVTA
ncbi:MAG: [LysW]-aminoadipate/[LysW]-glutamate kinase [Nitrososphaerales archaeon]|nr:[LysW]-aminoadipate/[LysW]-glutamate kinase [Nitrososphaerales archaeon]